MHVLNVFKKLSYLLPVRVCCCYNLQECTCLRWNCQQGQVVEMERQSCTEEQERLEQQLKDISREITAKHKTIKELEKEVRPVSS